MLAEYNSCEAVFCRLMNVTNGFGGAVAHTEILLFAEYNGCEAAFCRLMDVTNGFGGAVAHTGAECLQGITAARQRFVA